MTWDIVGWGVRGMQGEEGVVIQIDPEEGLIVVKWDVLGNITEHRKGDQLEIMLVPPPEIQKIFEEELRSLQERSRAAENIQTMPWLN